MSTDNRHRPGFKLTCRKCAKSGPSNISNLRRMMEGDVPRAVSLVCLDCGNRWVSRCKRAIDRPMWTPAERSSALSHPPTAPQAQEPTR